MGKLFIISGPSGVGKGTIVKRMQEISGDDFVLSVSCTTREKRNIEKDGEHYFFISKDKFDEMLADEMFIEWNTFLENKYGTPRKFVDDQLKNGKNVVLEIEANGTKQIVKNCKLPSVLIYIMPPSIEELTKRIRNRRTETDDAIRKRIEKSKNEMKFSKDYHFVLTNHKVDETAKKIIEIIRNEQNKKN